MPLYRPMRATELDTTVRGLYRGKKGRFTTGIPLTAFTRTGASGFPYALRFSITTFGASETIRAIKNVLAETEKQVIIANLAVAKKVLRTADLYVPTDTGEMRKSGRIVFAKEGALPNVGKESYANINQRISIEYGNQATPYTPIVHERTDLRHGSAFLAHQFMQRAERAKTDVGRGRNVTKLSAVIKNVGSVLQSKSVGNHRPQERAGWITYAYSQCAGFIETTYAAALKKGLASAKALKFEEKRIAATGRKLVR